MTKPETTALEVIDILKHRGGRYGFGQVLLELSWTHPTDEAIEEYKSAMDTLLDLKQHLKDTIRRSRQKKATFNPQVADILKPDTSAWCVLVHIFSAQNLPSTDINGAADPYLKASIYGAEAQTSAKSETLFPFWYETLALKVEFAKSQDYLDSGLVSPLVLQLYDRDTFSGDDFMGRCEISLKNVGPELPESPKWYPIKLAASEQVAGRVLVSLQVMPLRDMTEKIDRGLSMARPKMRKCTIEFFLLGCRNLQPKDHIKPQAPFVTFKLNGDGARGLIQTTPQSFPTAHGPNYLETMRINCFLPEDPAFAPSVTVKVVDRRFGVLRPVLGSAYINLRKFLPWIPKNRTRIEMRNYLNMPLKDQPVHETQDEVKHVDSGSDDEPEPEPEPEPEVGGEPEPESLPSLVPLGRSQSGMSFLTATDSRDNDDERTGLLADIEAPKVSPKKPKKKSSSMKEKLAPVIRGQCTQCRTLRNIWVSEGLAPMCKKEKCEGAMETVWAGPKGLMPDEFKTSVSQASDKPAGGEAAAKQTKPFKPGDTVIVTATTTKLPENDSKLAANLADIHGVVKSVDGDSVVVKLSGAMWRKSEPTQFEKNELRLLRLSAPREDPGKLDDLPPWMKGRLMPDGKILDGELEKEVERNTIDGVSPMPFDEWQLMRKILTDEKGAVKEDVGAGHVYGEVKGLIRIIDHHANREDQDTEGKTRKEINALSDRLPFNLDVNKLMTPQSVVVRLYCTQAIGLKAMDKGKRADPYITCRLGHKVLGDNSEHIKETINPYFGRCFEFHTTMPGPANLHIMVKDYDRLGRDEEIGRTKIDLEDRFFGAAWKKLETKPLERRTLRLRGSKMSRGKIECWVDILTKEEAAAHPVIDIKAEEPVEFEMRMVVWQARNVPALDAMSKQNDMFFSAQLTTTGPDNGKPDKVEQETDVHWRSKHGKGSFNWRMVFDVQLPTSDHSPDKLSIKCYDKDPLTFSNDLIGYTEIPVGKELFKPALRKWRKYRASVALCCVAPYVSSSSVTDSDTATIAHFLIVMPTACFLCADRLLLAFSPLLLYVAVCCLLQRDKRPSSPS